MFFPEIAHQTCEQESAGEYAYAATDISKRSAGEKVVVIPNTFNEAMSLPVRADVLERGLGRTRRHFVVLSITCVLVEGELSVCCVRWLFGWIGDRLIFEITALALRGVLKKRNGACFVSQYFMAWTVSLSVFACIEYKCDHRKHLNKIGNIS